MKAVLLLLVICTTSLAQDVDAGDTLKIGVKLVQIIFSAVDERGRPVSDLTEADVEVYENGEQQQIEVFQRSNTLPMLLAVLIDASASQESLLTEEKNAVEAFLDYYFREGRDYGALLTFRGESTLEVALTGNLRRLKTALRRIKQPQNFRDEDDELSALGTALYDAILTTVREILGSNTAARITESDKSGTRRAIRRAIILLSDGKDTASNSSLKKAIRNAQRFGVSIYTIGIGDSFRYGEVDRATLDSLAVETGGRAYYPVDQKQLEDAFEQIARELSTQYILAYYPASSTDRFRTVELRIKRPKVQAVHKKGYSVDELEEE
ncbi:MAG: VWA domain-containing protein [Acidobacteriota bacterium]|nr:VWA domain-containing protein [Blastocatellia bacterium]MDW8412313.1 VWA domain-containing protein [Acidobacteriota bacterium]